MPNQYLTPDVISLLADEMVVEFFEQGDLTSTSRVPEIAGKVQERLREERLPSRWSLAKMIARQLQYKWRARVLLTQTQLRREN